MTVSVCGGEVIVQVFNKSCYTSSNVTSEEAGSNYMYSSNRAFIVWYHMYICSTIIQNILRVLHLVVFDFSTYSHVQVNKSFYTHHMTSDKHHLPMIGYYYQVNEWDVQMNESLSWFDALRLMSGDSV